MKVRTIQWAALLGLVMFLAGSFTWTACPSRPPRDGGDEGCTGVCDDAGMDAGTDAGSTTDAGVDAGRDAGPVVDAGNPNAFPCPGPTFNDGGTVTLAELASLPLCTHVRINNVVIHTLNRQSVSGTDWSSEFWVTDGSDGGAYVNKFRADPPTTYAGDAGDLLTLDGFLTKFSASTDGRGYRPYIGDLYPGTGTPRLNITVLGTAPIPPPASIDAGDFGNAVGGTVQANPEAAGTLVHINGPLTITNSLPPAFRRFSYDAGVLVESSPGGFEVTGGILVNDSRTFRTCDWRSAADAGSTVTFPNGITGVWDTYTHQPFCNPFPACATFGAVPGADASYTYVLYPRDCVSDLDGGATP